MDKVIFLGRDISDGLEYILFNPSKELPRYFRDGWVTAYKMVSDDGLIIDRIFTHEADSRDIEIDSSGWLGHNQNLSINGRPGRVYYGFNSACITRIGIQGSADEEL